jgi:GNAT superfamily N-acetyltransferase
MFPLKAATGVRGTKMAYFRDNLRSCFTVCIAIGSALGALFGLALMATSLTGKSLPSRILIGSCGFILLAISVPVFMAIRSHAPVTPKSGSDSLSGLAAENYTLGIASTGLSGLAHKVHRNLQDYGWHITVQKSLAYLVRSVYFRQVYRIYRIKLDATTPTQDLNNHNFSFKILTAQNVEMIAQIENIAEWLRGRLTEAIAAGQLCLVALDGNEVAGFNLINFDHATLVLVNLKKKLRRGLAWSEHIAVKKEFRKAGLGSTLRYRIFQELKRRGILRLYGGTLRSNTASLALTRSVGFKEIGEIHYRKFFSLEKWRCKRVRG